MLLSLLSGDKSFSLTLDTILQASHPKTLKTALNQTQQFKQFQQLCDFQKKEEKLPYACYKISKNWKDLDPWCLKLKAQNLTLKILQKYSNLRELSPRCRQHLSTKLQLLKYQQQDFILPQIKNHWTDE